MNLNSVLDEGRSLSNRESHLNFISYWADKTVEEAVLQGQQLRMQKPHPLPSREYDVVNIDFIKPPRSVKSFGRRRKKAAKVSPKRHRSKSPSKAVSRSTNLPRKRKKRQKSVSCGMRIAELAVPTKRYCLETWRDKYSTLPDYMIDRLRQHVLDQRPVVQISDAIYCFKRKCKRQQKDEKSANKTVESKSKQIKNPIWKNEVNVLGAIFGHRIAKKLIVPLNIILNTDLQKIATVISYDVGELMRKSRNIDTKNKLYKLIEKDIVEKVTIWVSGVLNQSNDKILEEQLREFEEEAGPALDCIDDLIDNVLDICIPVPETYEDSFLSESDGTSLERGDSKTEYVYENIKDYFRNEIVTLINNIGEEEDQRSDEFIDVDKDPDLQSSEDIEANDLDQKINDDVETKDAILEQASDEEVAGMEQTEGDEGITLEETEGEMENLAVELPDDTEDLQNEKGATEQPSENTETQDTDVQNGNSEAKNYEFESNNANIESNDEAALNISEGSIESADEKADEYLEYEDAPQSTKGEARPENTDDITETFADATEENDEEALSEETDKKVTFDEHEAEVNRKALFENIEFAEPNAGLLSDADESWPEDARTPVLHPSQSVSKSITSLGKIKEVEEKVSIKPEEDNGEQDEKKSTITQPLKSNDETAFKDSEQKDKRAKLKRISESKIGKPPSKKSPSGRQRSSSKPSKIVMPTSPTKPISKTFKKLKDKNKKAASKDTDSTRASQNAKDLESDVTMKSDTFSSEVKSKPDYRVNVKTAPAWINRNFAEPSCSCAHIPSKSKVKPRLNKNLIRRWCEDLEQGYENLKMWNDWVENTTRTVCMMQREIGKSHCSEKCSNKEWLQLKRNIDKDAHLWKRLNHQTQERIKCYKKMFQKRSDTSSNYFIRCSLQK